MTDAAPQKSLTDLLWERENALEKGTSNRNRIEFLKAKDDIQAALDEGWSGRMIWEQLRDEGRIRFGHSAFARYVRTLIQGKPALGKPRSKVKRPAHANLPVDTGETDFTPKPKPTRFSHDPAPRKEDYV